MGLKTARLLSSSPVGAPAPRSAKRPSERIGRFTSRSLLLIYALLIVVPIVVVVFGSFKNQSQIILNPLGPPSKGNLEGYRKVISEHIFRALKNSVIVVAFSVSLTLFAASLTAFAVARMGGWRSNVLFGFFTLGMAVPAQVNGIQQYTMFKSVGLTNSLAGLILVNMAVTLPVSVFILTGFMKTLPKELFEAGVVDGASPWRLYRSIAMPLSMPSVAAVAIFLFVAHWNDLYYPLLFITDESKWTLPRTLAQLRGEFLTDYPALFAGVVIASAPMVAAYVFLQRWFVAGLTSGAVKG
jgi:raffinose/stachyose/melibiose transport system permease protein